MNQGLKETAPECGVHEPQKGSMELFNINASIKLHGVEEFGKQLDELTEKARTLSAVIQGISSSEQLRP